MRPVRIELEGFTAFREPTTVDFEGVDFFALTGPTGSGKTSVLDAIVFALYGNVPRLADQRAVAPVIAQQMAEARVRLDFTVGADAYTATRIVRTTKAGGGTTAEARLERTADGEVLAGNADDVTSAVTELLGLTYDHFTKCVVLPQGEFARFLHDKPKDRQDLLVTLLELGVYGRMATVAGQRAGKSGADANVLEGRLSDLAHATPDAIAAAAARIDQLNGLLTDLGAAQPELIALADRIATASADATAGAEAASRLAAVVIPAGLADVHDRLALARDALAASAEILTRAESLVVERETATGALPDRTELTRVLDAHDRADALRERLGKGSTMQVERAQDVEAATVAVEAAEHALADARTADEQAAAAHRAHAVRADLRPGEPCPVCLQDVGKVPTAKAPPALEKARHAREAAEKKQRAATTALTAATSELAKVEATLAGVRDDLAAAEAVLTGAPDRAAIATQLAAITEATEALDAARAQLTVARKARDDAATAAQQALDAEAALRSAYDDARDAVAALDPPARLGGGAPLVDEWTSLAEWASRESAVRAQRAQQVQATIDELEATRAQRLSELRERCAAADVDATTAEPTAAAQTALGKAIASHEQLEGLAGDAARLQSELAGVVERRDVARALAMHLDARHFEKWVLDEAMSALAEGATALLQTLSSGQYSLRVDKRGTFVVVDHRNADAVRSARTLSGGETFLTSLALALALADRIATMAASGSKASTLESIFLDEGFGTLDPDTLDVVAGAIEELGASGRMVGVVSHVADLAERLPVRYEVRRIGNASTIERVDR